MMDIINRQRLEMATMCKIQLKKQHIDGNASKPPISKMHNVQETQKTVSVLNK